MKKEKILKQLEENKNGQYIPLLNDENNNALKDIILYNVYNIIDDKSISIHNTKNSLLLYKSNDNQCFIINTYDENNNCLTAYSNFYGEITIDERTFNKDNNQLTLKRTTNKESFGTKCKHCNSEISEFKTFTSESTYDENGKEIAYKDSNGNDVVYDNYVSDTFIEDLLENGIKK